MSMCTKKHLCLCGGFTVSGKDYTNIGGDTLMKILNGSRGICIEDVLKIRRKKQGERLSREEKKHWGCSWEC